MGNRLIFLYQYDFWCKEGRRRLSRPGDGSRFKAVGWSCWQIRNSMRPRAYDERGTSVSPEVADPMLPRKSSYTVKNFILTVPQTNSGGQVENTKALERTVVKELGKLQP